MERQLFSKLVQLAKSQRGEGRRVVVGALVNLIQDYPLCADHKSAILLAVAVWKESTYLVDLIIRRVPSGAVSCTLPSHLKGLVFGDFGGKSDAAKTKKNDPPRTKTKI